VKVAKETTQHRVYGVLKLSDKPMTAYEVAVCLGKPKQTVASHLKALSRGDFVVCHKDEKATNALFMKNTKNQTYCRRIKRLTLQSLRFHQLGYFHPPPQAA
jgi:DNA-binding transcriptional regulator GbsR (MarR family)